MSKISRVAGTTSQIVNVFAQDTTLQTGAGKTGLTNASFACYYKRNLGASSVAVTLDASSGVILGTYEPVIASHGAIKEIDSANMPGLYEFQIPNNALASGADNVTLMLTGTGIRVAPIDIELTGWNNQDAVHGGMSALPNTACTTNASLLTSGNSTDQLSVSAGKVLLQATQTGVTIPTVTTLTNLPSIPANWLTAAGIAASALNGKGDWLLAANVPANFSALLISAGGHISNVDTLTTYTGDTPQTGDAFARLGAPAGTSVSADMAAVKSDTGTILNDVNTGAGAIYNRLGAPAGASMSADIAAVKANCVTLIAGVNVSAINATTVHGNGSTIPWGP
jgi:hypothetical protein